MTTQNSNTNNYLISFIFSLIGALVLTLTDFAGWSEPTYYGHNEYYVFIGSETAPIFSQIMLGIMIIGLFLVTFYSYKGMQGEITDNELRRGYFLSIGVIILIIFGAILFYILASDATATWLDAGFYAGLVGSAICAFFLHKQITD